MGVLHVLHSKWILLLIGGALVLGAGVYLGRTLACQQDRCATPSDGSSGLRLAGTSSVSIAGTAQRPLSPGVRAPLNLTLTNREDAALTADRLRVAVVSVDAPLATTRRACTVEDFVVVQASSELTITLEPGETTTMLEQQVRPAAWPMVGMRSSSTNQDGCKGASVRLRYTANGMRTEQVDG
jgi:hypothetical protein